MFFRQKRSGDHVYLQIVENRWEKGRSRQRVIATIGRLDRLREGGVELGQYGHSKDHRPDRKQMVVGVILDGEGRPLCCELWPGNVTDVKTLIPVVDRLQQRIPQVSSHGGAEVYDR